MQPWTKKILEHEAQITRLEKRLMRYARTHIKNFTAVNDGEIAA